MMVVLFFVLALAAAIYMTTPFSWERFWPFLDRSAVAELQRAKRNGIWAISDVDNEYAMGKIAQEDYVSLRDRLKDDLHEIMRRERELLGGYETAGAEGVPATLKSKLMFEVLRICGLKRS